MSAINSLSTSRKLTLLHDPASAKSEYALQALQLGCLTFDVRHVTLGEPLTETELRDLIDRLVGDPVDALIRRGRTYDRLGLDMTGAGADQVISTLLDHPALLQTPILDDGNLVMIGSPIERAEAWAVTGHVTDAQPTMSFPAVKLPAKVS